MKNDSKKSIASFAIPSIIGIIIFMIPIKYSGEWTIIVKIIADLIGNALASFLPLLCVFIITVSAVLSVISLAKPRFMTDRPMLWDIFGTTPVWAIIRTVGAVFLWLTFLGIDADDDDTGFIHMITEGGAGGFVLSDLLTVLVIIFAIAGLLLPLLLDFGLLEFVGAMLTCGPSLRYRDVPQLTALHRG